MNNKVVKGKMILVNEFSLEFPESWNYNEIESYIIEHIDSIRNTEEEVIVKIDNIENIDEVVEDECN